MTDRDRLIELVDGFGDDVSLCDCCKRPSEECEACKNEQLADHLLANGVIVPPCKVGDMVYIPWYWDGITGVAFAEVEEIRIYDNKNHIMFFIELQSDIEEFNQKYGGWKSDKSIGDTVFLTKEEAEAKLKECVNNGRIQMSNLLP